MFNTGHNEKMIEVLSGPERRRRRTAREKIAIVQQTMEPGMTVSNVARLHGINANQVFTWRRQYQNGSLTAVCAGEEVVPASALTAAMKQIKELQRLLRKKTMEVELLKEAVEYGRAKKMDSARALAARGFGLTQISRALNVSRAQLSVYLLRPAEWQDRRQQPNHNDGELISRIRHHTAELPTYGYRRVWALLRDESQQEGLPMVNAKRVYRVMRDNHLLLERKGVPKEQRSHNGRVAVAESNLRWCSDRLAPYISRQVDTLKIRGSLKTMFNTGHNEKMIEVLSGPERRRRRTAREKIAIVQQTMEPGMTVSHVARLHGINANQVFTWRRQYQNGSLTAVCAGEEVVPASALTAAMKQIKELQRLLGKKTMEVELLKEAVEYGRAKKMDSARALAARGFGLTQISSALNVSRAQLSVYLLRPAEWQDRRQQPNHNDGELISRIRHHTAELPTYGYRRVWALLRDESQQEGLPMVNAKRVYRVMRDNHLLLERKGVPKEQRSHNGRVAVAESNLRWCSDGFEFNCDNGDKLRVTFALDCCDREALDWIATNGGYSSEIVMDVMVNSVSKRFGNELPEVPIEFLSDNGSCYTAKETKAFGNLLNLETRTTAVRSPQSNGMAESFVKTMKRDYISMMPKPNQQVALKNLAIAFEHYNEKHPHSALGYRSPREYRRQRESLT